ncbi:hypothetical protein CDAR_193081 [Caerostris darwini]|uniref:Uncharacterized protein n=1 Tax=Caerostris darwini TaxID=1538125 RepID=A0AAV4U0E0_9ARAC|nr:hypothetical protein CDAR_193081 [Caerostris darwini]
MLNCKEVCHQKSDTIFDIRVCLRTVSDLFLIRSRMADVQEVCGISISCTTRTTARCMLRFRDDVFDIFWSIWWTYMCFSFYAEHHHLSNSQHDNNCIDSS